MASLSGKKACVLNINCLQSNSLLPHPNATPCHTKKITIGFCSDGDGLVYGCGAVSLNHIAVFPMPINCHVLSDNDILARTA